MRVWLITIGEPVPVDDEASDRLLRTGYFAKFLNEHGHHVTWWTSSFDHWRKQHIGAGVSRKVLSSGLNIELLHGRGYQRNVSWQRVVNHRQLANDFRRRSRAVSVLPDVIVCSLPTVELCQACEDFAEDRGIPVVLDMRDMWPDVFVTALPRALWGWGNRLLCWQRRKAARVLGRATAITGITDAFVDWGIRRGGRQRGPLDQAFPMGYSACPPKPDALREAETFWDQHGVVANSDGLIACFFGTLGHQLDIDTLIGAAAQCAVEHLPIQFVICGTGDRFAELCARAELLPNVKMPGWVDAAKIYTLMRRSQVGLDPLPDRFDFLATINNKAIEYWSAGLPVISSPPRGVLAEVLAGNQCGLSYEAGQPQQLVTCLRELLAHPTRLAKYAANSQRLFRQQYSATQVYGRMMKYLETIAS